jgi:zinc transporter ZupT
VGELNTWQQRAQEELLCMDGTDTKTSESLAANETGEISYKDGRSIPKDHDSDLSNSDGNNCNNRDSFHENQGTPADERGNKVLVENAPMSSQREQKKLMTMGLSTAVAIGLHNFPEGLATFVSALADTSVGVVFAVAIGIHNIPEGLCVALPIYYATGNRWKAFMWGCLSGLSEPVAALLGWLILADAMSDIVYAILFGIVSGMMVIISLKELIPTAHRYDPEDTVVTYSLIFGMAIIALSLVMFKV